MNFKYIYIYIYAIYIYAHTFMQTLKKGNKLKGKAFPWHKNVKKTEKSLVDQPHGKILEHCGYFLD